MTFPEALNEELKDINHRRRQRKLPLVQGDDTQSATAEERARQGELVGLALSGGGIRSATFCLGVLQGLARLRLLGLFDYLSTVSGGGYVGGWLAAWVKREPGRFAEVEKQLCPVAGPLSSVPAPVAPQGDEPPKQPEAPPLRHLRRYSNYLAPRLGAFSTDGWALWAVYLRNLLLNQCVILPLTVLVLLLSRAVMLAYFPWSEGDLVREAWEILTPLSVTATLWIFGAVAGCWLLAFALLFGVAIHVRAPGGAATGRAGSVGRAASWVVGTAVVLLLVSAAVFCAASPYELPWGELPGCGPHTSIWPWCHPDTSAWPQATVSVWDRTAQPLVFGVVVAAVITGALLLAFGTQLDAHRAGGGRVLGPLLAAALAGFAGGVGLYGVYSGLHALYIWNGEDPLESVLTQGAVRTTTFGPPLVLLVAILAIALGVALRRRDQGEELREWWSAVAGRLLRIAVIWLAVNLVALYGTALVLWAGPWLRTVLASGWLATVVGGVLSGNSKRTDGSQPRRSFPELLARVTPYVFVGGLLIAVSLLVHVIMDNPPDWDAADNDAWPQRPVPEHPPLHVTHTSTIDPDTDELRNKTVREQDEFEWVPDQSAAVRQGYWLGFLNHIRRAVPTVVYKVDGQTTFLLNRAGLLPPEWDRVSKELQGVVNNIRMKQREAAKRKVAERQAQKQALTTGESSQDPLPPVPGPECYYTREELRRALLELMPERGKLEQRRAVLAAARRFTLELPAEQKAEATCRKPESGIGMKLIEKLLIWFGVFSLVLALAFYCVDVNLYSLHAVYGNRLVRGYLGGSRPQRAPDPVTGLDPDDDDVKLASLRPNLQTKTGYDGPFLIVNAALNLVSGEELAWQERKAASFPLTPVCCGWRAADGDSFRPTAQVSDKVRGYGHDLTLGTAMTISGAAASPNSGYHSSTAVTILLTVFNARLGAWLGNPKHDSSWNTAGPPGGLFYLLRELLGLTDDHSGYVYLSDGGHFENLGAYELIRRRCRHVVLCDADEDADHAFDDLGSLIRKCRVDFGIRIEMDVEALRLSASPRRSRWHCAIGKIHYEDAHPGTKPGTLVYLKPSLSGDEPVDVLHYAVAHPDFPHQSTGNQFFNESQFESYRALGLHVAEAVFGEAANEATGMSAGALPAAAEVFEALQRRWFPMPPEYEPSFLISTQGYIAVQEQLQRDDYLRQLTLELYPELTKQLQKPKQPAEKTPKVLTSEQTSGNVPKPQTQEQLQGKAPEELNEETARRCAEIHAVAQMLQVMENVWLSLKLDVNHAHPLNRGWMNVFDRWMTAPTFLRLWPQLSPEFSDAFVRFCERQMTRLKLSFVSARGK